MAVDHKCATPASGQQVMGRHRFPESVEGGRENGSQRKYDSRPIGCSGDLAGAI